MARSINHPTADDLRAYSLGQLADSASRHIERHLMGCPECKSQLFEVPASDAFIDWLQKVHRERREEPAPPLDQP